MSTTVELARISKLPEFREDRMHAILTRETWLGCDWHVGPKCPDRANQIITVMNKMVKPNDDFFFLGDFDERESKGGNTYAFMSTMLEKINCKNIYMIWGDNDNFKLYEYINMGIKGVARRIAKNVEGDKMIYLSHFPMPPNAKEDELNIHGHIHGAKQYWNMDWRLHYDVWDDNYVPIKLRDAIVKAVSYKAITVKKEDD